MILRRFSQSLKEQDWTAIAIEFVLLVAGVFLGIEVANWNSERELSKRKTAAVSRLQLESEAAVRAIADRAAMYSRLNRERAEAMQRLVDSNWNGADLDSMTAAFESLILAPAVSPPRSVYDELISTGLFAETGDASMRDAISGYYAYLSYLQGQIDYIRQGITRKPDLHEFPGIRYTYDAGAFRGERAIYDFEALSANPSFISYAVAANASQIALQGWWTNTFQRAMTMCREIGRYSGRPCTPDLPDDMPADVVARGATRP